VIKPPRVAVYVGSVVSTTQTSLLNTCCFKIVSSKMAGDNKPANTGKSGKPEAIRDKEGVGGRAQHHNCGGNRPSNATAEEIDGTNAMLVRQPAFEGRVKGLKGHIYNCCYKQAVLFIMTTKESSGYVGQKFCTAVDDIHRAVDALALPTIEKPARPTMDNDLDKVKWIHNFLKSYQAHMAKLDNGMKRLYNIVTRQCSNIMMQKLTAIGGYETKILGKSDAIKLLKAIQQISFNFESQKFKLHAIHSAMQRFYTSRQGPHMTTQAYTSTSAPTMLP
jgi:hypothetical protein